MIQHVSLRENGHDYGRGLDWQAPMELIINVNDYKSLKKTIKTLFDRQSVKLIKKSKALLSLK